MAYVLPGYAPFRNRSEARVAAKSDPGIARALYRHRLARAAQTRPGASTAELRGHFAKVETSENTRGHFAIYTVPATKTGLQSLIRFLAPIQRATPDSSAWLTVYGVASSDAGSPKVLDPKSHRLSLYASTPAEGVDDLFDWLSSLEPLSASALLSRRIPGSMVSRISSLGEEIVSAKTISVSVRQL